eukprot:CAMPEP_0204031138 /NCGR_PEP_ID=MMETSP0360-20130528/61808_1 /ASSEMBLY_ACC=CAM_ASM_000342 /TAXON_ID=268821 /ORGANISM="Scrippsiella Hangoei, Strain SHTV-5" /LENGTH=80 /DNA_ID=CAMNT_0050975321 /DNA_START=75 /DNA_END=313 /DNA_ORIENTATION=+
MDRFVGTTTALTVGAVCLANSYLQSDAFVATTGQKSLSASRHISAPGSAVGAAVGLQEAVGANGAVAFGMGAGLLVAAAA